MDAGLASHPITSLLLSTALVACYLQGAEPGSTTHLCFLEEGFEVSAAIPAVIRVLWEIVAHRAGNLVNPMQRRKEKGRTIIRECPSTRKTFHSSFQSLHVLVVVLSGSHLWIRRMGVRTKMLKVLET